MLREPASGLEQVELQLVFVDLRGSAVQGYELMALLAEAVIARALQ